MASLLASWVHDTLKLPDKITRFETDCANGLVFYNVLHKLGFVEESEELQLAPRTTSSGRRSNLRAIVPLLRSKLHISLSDNDITLIATEQRGAATKLLYQIKERYEEMQKPKVYKKTSALDGSGSRQKFVREKGDSFVEKCLDAGMTQSQVAMEVHLKRFVDSQRLTEAKAKETEEEEVEQELEEMRQRRQEMLQSMQARRQFKQEWEDTGKQKWKANQRTKIERERKELSYELSMQERSQIKQENARRAAKMDMHTSLDEFERNMRRMGIDIGAGEVDIGMEEEQDALARPKGKSLTTPTVELAKNLPGGKRQLLLEEKPSEYLQRMEAELEFQFDPKEVKGYETALRYKMKTERTAKKEKETRLRKAEVDQSRIQRSIAQKVAFEDKLAELLELSANERTAAAQVIPCCPCCW